MRIIDELLSAQKRYNINTWTFETAKVDKAIGPFLDVAMRTKNIWLNIHKETPTQSKTMRASSIRAMHRSGSIRYDKDSSWWKDFNEELAMVAESGPRGRHDDQFDAFAYLGLTVDKFFDAQSDEEMEDEEYEEMFEQYHSLGRCASTGY
jgi:hypothetical protein